MSSNKQTEIVLPSKTNYKPLSAETRFAGNQISKATEAAELKPTGSLPPEKTVTSKPEECGPSGSTRHLLRRGRPKSADCAGYGYAGPLHRRSVTEGEGN